MNKNVEKVDDNHFKTTDGKQFWDYCLAEDHQDNLDVLSCFENKKIERASFSVPQSLTLKLSNGSSIEIHVFKNSEGYAAMQILARDENGMAV